MSGSPNYARTNQQSTVSSCGCEYSCIFKLDFVSEKKNGGGGGCLPGRHFAIQTRLALPCGKNLLYAPNEGPKLQLFLLISLTSTYFSCTWSMLRLIQGCWLVLRLTRKEKSYSDRRFWVSYILFIIIIGGILVLYIYIQGVPGGKDLTSGECSLCQTIPI